MMSRKTAVGILIVLVIIAVGIWILQLRSMQHPKEYTGEQPSGPGAPMKMDAPMAIGGQGASPGTQQRPPTSKAPVEAF